VLLLHAVAKPSRDPQAELQDTYTATRDLAILGQTSRALSQTKDTTVSRVVSQFDRLPRVTLTTIAQIRTLAIAAM
jgi:hypothetical protein